MCLTERTMPLKSCRTLSAVIAVLILITVGPGVGDALGLGDGDGLGDALGLGDGDALGLGDGEALGLGDGDVVGVGEGDGLIQILVTLFWHTPAGAPVG
jgi:hypothetical protein